MNKIGFLGLLFVTLGASAQVLGEMKGEGTLSYTQQGQVRSGECKVAMNIRQNPSQFALDFSVFECGNLGMWNDPSVALTVKGNELVDNDGQTVGEVFADGTYKFTLKSSQKYKYMFERIDFNCQVLSVEPRTISYETEITYTVRNIGGNYYTITRNENRETLMLKTFKPYKHCRGTTVYGKDPITTSLSVVVK